MRLRQGARGALLRPLVARLARYAGVLVVAVSCRYAGLPRVGAVAHMRRAPRVSMSVRGRVVARGVVAGAYEGARWCSAPARLATLTACCLCVTGGRATRTGCAGVVAVSSGRAGGGAASCGCVWSCSQCPPDEGAGRQGVGRTGTRAPAEGVVRALSLRRRGRPCLCAPGRAAVSGTRKRNRWAGES